MSCHYKIICVKKFIFYTFYFCFIEALCFYYKLVTTKLPILYNFFLVLIRNHLQGNVFLFPAQDDDHFSSEEKTCLPPTSFSFAYSEWGQLLPPVVFINQGDCFQVLLAYICAGQIPISNWPLDISMMCTPPTRILSSKQGLK